MRWRARLSAIAFFLAGGGGSERGHGGAKHRFRFAHPWNRLCRTADWGRGSTGQGGRGCQGPKEGEGSAVACGAVPNDRLPRVGRGQGADAVGQGRAGGERWRDEPAISSLRHKSRFARREVTRADRRQAGRRGCGIFLILHLCIEWYWQRLLAPVAQKDSLLEPLLLAMRRKIERE